MSGQEALPPLPPKWTARFRKVPVEVQAVQITPENAAEVWEWAGSAVAAGQARDVIINVDDGLTIRTLEGDLRAPFGYWVVRGVRGEFHPVRPDIFAETYEPADAARPDDGDAFWGWMEAYTDEPHQHTYEASDMESAFSAGSQAAEAGIRRERAERLHRTGERDEARSDLVRMWRLLGEVLGAFKGRPLAVEGWRDRADLIMRRHIEKAVVAAEREGQAAPGKVHVQIGTERFCLRDLGTAETPGGVKAAPEPPAAPRNITELAGSLDGTETVQDTGGLL